MSEVTPKRFNHWFSRHRARAAAALALAAVIALGLSACGGDSSSDTSSASTGGGDEGGDPVKIAVVLKDASAPYWHAAQEGAEEAAQALGGKVEVTIGGVETETDSQGQVDNVENAVTAGAEAIVIAPTEPESLKPALEKVSAEGIKVITIDSPVPDFDAVSTIATNNFEGGEEAFTAMSKILPEGEVGIISGPPGLGVTDERAEGFEKLAAGGKIKVVAVLGSQCDQPTGVKDAENMITAHPNLAGIYAVCGEPATGAAQAIKGAGLTGEVKLVGFDASEAEIPLIESGLEDASVAQHPEKMGKLGVEYAYKSMQGESVPKEVNSGIEIVTKANVADFK